MTITEALIIKKAIDHLFITSPGIRFFVDPLEVKKTTNDMVADLEREAYEGRRTDENS